ncbi:MAG: tetratricopeptide repeat protein, partial [Anaerolineae bacterium]
MQEALPFPQSGPLAELLTEPLALDEEGFQELERLCVALASLRGHPGLFLVFCDSPLLRDRLIAEVTARLPGWSIAIFRITRTFRDVPPWLTAGEAAKGDAVFLVVESEAIHSVAYLNYRREILSRLSCPVTLWFPHTAEQEVRRLAPDFWAFRRQVFLFRLSAPWLMRISHKVAVTEIPAETPQDRKAGIALLRQLLQDLEAAGAGETVLMARLRRELGDLLRREARGAESRQELERALAILETLEGEEAERAHTCYSLGLTLYYLDEYDAALESYQAALAIYRAIGDRLGEANVQQALGDLALRE